MTSPSTAAEWLGCMFGANAPGHIVLWEKSTKDTVAFPATMIEAAANAACAIGAVGEVYYGLGLQLEKPQGRSRGKGDSVCALGGLWFDFDIAGDGHAQSALPKSLDDIKGLLAELPHAPTAIIHSGGGVHTYWLFDQLLTLNSPTERKKAQALSSAWQRNIVAKGEARGWKLDTTSDLARILRLPGTFNRKTSEPRPVSVIEWTGTRYRPSQLEIPSAIKVAQHSSSAPRWQPASASRAKKSEAPWMLSCPWVRHCVDDAATLPEPEWYALLTLLAECEDGEEYALEWSSPHPEFSEAKTLAKFRHAQQAPGGRSCRSIGETFGGEYCKTCKYGDRLISPDFLTRPAWGLAAEYAYSVEAVDFFHHKTRRRLSKEQFSDLHALPFGKGTAASHVLHMPNLIRAAGYDYRPGSPTILIDGDDTRINLWVDDGVKASNGDVQPFLDHLAYLLPDEAARLHLLRWMAFTVQRPAQRVKHAMILSGKQGTGKSYMARVLKLIHGPSNVHEVSVEELHGQFTAWLEGKQVVLIEELMAGGRLELANKLKPILTQEVIRINEKHKRVYQVRNLASFFCTTNHEDPIYVEEGDRRWWFYRSPAEPRSPEYYFALEQWTAENAGAIKGYLSKVDLTGFNPNAAPPITKDKERLIRASLSPVEWLLMERRDDGAYPFDRELVQLDQLFAFVRETIPAATIQQLVRVLGHMGARKLSRSRINGQQVTIYALRRQDHWTQAGQDQLREQLLIDGLRPFIMPPAAAQTSL